VSGRKIPRGTAIALIIGGDLVLLVLGWFMLVAPQRATAKSNARAAAAAEVQVIEAQRPAVPLQPTTQPKQPEIRTAYLYKLSKAMPMTTDMPNLLLELNQVVRSAGVELASISPAPIDPSGVTGITLAVDGDFYSLTDLLYRLRSLVTVRDGSLDVSGRLFAIKAVSLTPSGVGTTLNASVSLNTFTFGAAAAAAAAPVATPTATDTTGATTTTDGSTTSSVSADTAIGH
jgi:Tfp pilus assembly protein PilO